MWSYDESGRFVRSGLLAEDMTHGIIERKTEDFDMEVDGVSRKVTLGPTPVRVFYDETLVCRQDKVTGIAGNELKAAHLEQWDERGKAGKADLFARPARLQAIEGSGGHSYFSSGVG